MTSSFYYTYICIYYIFHVRQRCGVFLPAIIAQKYTHVCHITICTIWYVYQPHAAHGACAAFTVYSTHDQCCCDLGHIRDHATANKEGAELYSTAGTHAISQRLTHIYLYIYSVHKQRQQSTHAALYMSTFQNVLWDVSSKPAELWFLDRRFVMWYMLHYGTAINKSSTRGHILHNAPTYNAILARIPHRIIFP